MVMDKSEYATHIRRLREVRGWTQSDLAAQLGVTQVHVSRWENGVNRPNRRTRDAIDALWAGVESRVLEVELKAGTYRITIERVEKK